MLLIKRRLPLAHHTKHMVVDDHFDERQMIARSRRKFIQVHPETPVSCDVHNLRIRIGDLCADGCAKPVSHGPETSGSQELPRLLIFIELRRPHLMLSDLCDDPRSPLRHLIDLFHDIWTGKPVPVVGQRIFLLILRNVGNPLFMFRDRLMGEPLVYSFEGLLQISHHKCIHRQVFIDLDRIHIKLQDFCLMGKGSGISENPIGKPCPKCDQKITFRDCEIACLTAVHAQHPGIVFLRPVISTLSHQRVAHRCMHQRHKLLQFL